MPVRMIVACTCAALLAVLSSSSRQLVAEEFSARSIDLGIVVSDVEKSVAFYKDAIGMKEVSGFSVPGDWCRDAGLTDGKKLDIRVMVLGEGPNASKLKLMQVPGVKTAKADNKFLHSTFGFSYITIGVADTTAALARLKKAGVKTANKTPIALPAPLPSSIILTVVRDPDGNMIELVGPRK